MQSRSQPTFSVISFFFHYTLYYGTQQISNFNLLFPSREVDSKQYSISLYLYIKYIRIHNNILATYLNNMIL